MKNKKVKACAFGLDNSIKYGTAGLGFAGSLLQGVGNEGSGVDIAGSSLTGLGAGAATGMTVGGPIGAAIGGAVGLAGGLVSGFNRRKKLREAERRKQAADKQMFGEAITANLQDEYYENNPSFTFAMANGGILPDLAYVDNNEIIRDDNGNIMQVPNNKQGTDNHLINASTLDSVLSNRLKRPGTNRTFAQEGKRLMNMTNKTKGSDRFARASKQLNDINANNAYNQLLAEQEEIKRKRGIKPKVKGIPAYADGKSQKPNIFFHFGEGDGKSVYGKDKWLQDKNSEWYYSTDWNNIKFATTKTVGGRGIGINTNVRLYPDGKGNFNVMENGDFIGEYQTPEYVKNANDAYQALYQNSSSFEHDPRRKMFPPQTNEEIEANRLYRESLAKNKIYDTDFSKERKNLEQGLRPDGSWRRGKEQVDSELYLPDLEVTAPSEKTKKYNHAEMRYNNWQTSMDNITNRNVAALNYALSDIYEKNINSPKAPVMFGTDVDPRSIQPITWGNGLSAFVGKSRSKNVTTEDVSENPVTQNTVQTAQPQESKLISKNTKPVNRTQISAPYVSLTEEDLTDPTINFVPFTNKLNSKFPTAPKVNIDLDAVKPVAIHTKLNRSTPTRQGFNFDIGSLTGLSPILYNLGQSFRKPEYEETVFNPYAASVTSALAKRRMNIDPLLDANRKSSAIARANAAKLNPNTGMNLAYNSQLNANNYAANGEIYANLANSNNQYLADYANMANNLGQQYAQARTLANDLNARNRAKARDFGAKAFGQLGQWSQTKEQMRNQARRDSMMLPYLQDYLSAVTNISKNNLKI